MVEKNKLFLGLTEGDRDSSIARLDQVFCTLSLALEGNLQLYWRTNGGKAGTMYRRKLDLTWEQIKRIGLRISALGGRPTLNPVQQQEKSLVPRHPPADLGQLAAKDLKGEDLICAGIRGHLYSLQTGSDWASMVLLGEILIQREEIVHELEMIFDDPVLEHIWEDEEMSMEAQETGRQRKSMH